MMQAILGIIVGLLLFVFVVSPIMDGANKKKDI